MFLRMKKMICRVCFQTWQHQQDTPEAVAVQASVKPGVSITMPNTLPSETLGNVNVDVSVSPSTSRPTRMAYFTQTEYWLVKILLQEEAKYSDKRRGTAQSALARMAYHDGLYENGRRRHVG